MNKINLEKGFFNFLLNNKIENEKIMIYNKHINFNLIKKGKINEKEMYGN